MKTFTPKDMAKPLKRRFERNSRELSMADDVSQPTAKPPTVTEFMDRLKTFADEIYCNGTRTASHSYPSTVEFWDAEGNTYRLADIEPERHLGCGCWVGIRFRLEREAD